MHAKPLALASAVAMAASVAAVQPEHPRIYFPRVIKREYQNSSVTTGSGASSKPDTTADSSTTKRDLLGDLISEILNSPPPSAPSTEAKKPAVTTVVIRSTVYVGGGGQPSGSGLPTVTILPTTKAIETTQPTTKTGSSTESGIIIGPTGIVSSTTAEPTRVASVDPPVGNSTTTTKGGILDPVGTLLSSLLPGPVSQSTSTGDKTIPLNSTAPATTTGILPPLTSLLPGGDTTTTSGTGSLPNATSTDISVTATTSGSTVTSIPTGTVTDVPVGNTTSTTTGTVPPATTVTDGPVTNGTVSLPPTGSATTLPTGSVPIGNSTLTGDPITATSTAIPTTVAETTASVPPTTDVGVTSLRPTATFSNSENWLPTTMVVEPTTFSYSPPTASTTGTTTQALPTTIPKNILPDDPPKSAPEGTVPIEIAFKYELNYVFVSNNTVAAAQIFKLLPLALAGCSGVSVDKLQISKLVPYNTQAKWGYITTMAKLNYPSTLVDTLQMDLRIPNSLFYTNADRTVRDLTDFVDIRFDLNGNIIDGAGSGATGGGAGGNNNNKNNNDAFGPGNQGEQSSKQKATTAGIAVACVGLSAMYGAAMFIVARRYKRKRQGHRRASSITNSQASSEMRYHGNGSPALMGGALMSREVSTYGGAGGRDSHASGGHSARTAGISAPVATENSLGWN